MRRFVVALAVFILIVGMIDRKTPPDDHTLDVIADALATAYTLPPDEPIPEVPPVEARSLEPEIAAAAPAALETPLALEAPVTDRLPEDDRARGLVYTGLRPGAPSGLCDQLYEITLPDGAVLCTPGPDATPLGIDARGDRLVADMYQAAQELAASLGDGGTATEVGGIACLDDGVSGPRVQAVYAVAADRTAWPVLNPWR